MGYKLLDKILAKNLQMKQELMLEEKPKEQRGNDVNVAIQILLAFLIPKVCIIFYK